MNNLVIAGAICLFGAAFLLNTQRNIASVREANSFAESRVRETREREAHTRFEIRRLEKLFEADQHSVHRFRAEVNASLEKNDAVIEKSEPSPEKDGVWPQDKPYFYLSKQRLAALDYWPLTERDELSETAATIFGMSAAELAAANQTYRTMRERVRELEKVNAIVTNTPSMFEGWAGTKTSLFLGPLPKEEIDAVDQEFKVGLNAAIGPSRGQLLGQRIDETFDRGAFAFAKARTLTLIRDGDQIQVCQTDAEGNMTSNRYTSDEGRQEVPRDFRHLFPQD